MDYKDIRTGQRVTLSGLITEAVVVAVDPRRIATGDPVQVRLRLPVTGNHTMWVDPAAITRLRAAVELDEG
jgi:hypothetical protein